MFLIHILKKLEPLIVARVDVCRCINNIQVKKVLKCLGDPPPISSHLM